jgi:uncharacterized membrane protein
MERGRFIRDKNLSGAGALLIFISFFSSRYTPFFGSGALGLIGLVIMLIGVKGLSEYYNEPGIFNNILYGSITWIVGGVVAIGAAIYVVLSSLTGFLYKIYPGWNGDWRSLSGFTPDTSNLQLSDVLPFIQALLIVFVILFVTVVIVAFFYRRSLNELSHKSGVGLFGTSGTVLLIGAVLTIILLGYIIVWISMLLIAIAFFQLSPPSQTGQSMQPTPSS